MQKIDWVKKLSSRKFWAAVCAFAASVLAMLHMPDGTAAQVTAIVMAGGSLIAYILSEGFIDAASASAAVQSQSGGGDGETPAKE